VLAQRAVVLDFDGASADHARDTVVRAVGADLTLVARSDIYRIARVAGVEVREAARREGVAIIIRGHVGATVDLVAQHVDGHVMGQISGPVPHSRTEVRRLARSARTLVANVLGGDGDGNGDGDGEAETPRKAATERARSRRPGRERAPNADAEGASHDSDGSGDGSGAELDPSLPPLVDVGVGLGLRSRDADVALANGARRRFRSGMFPEIVGVALLRPFRASGRLAAGVFAAAHLAYGVGLTTLDENENVLDTQVFRLRADAGYLLPYEIAEIGIVVGLGYDAFSLPEDSQLFPSANYGYTRIGLSGRIALAGSLLRLDIDLGARIVLDAGPLTPFFGQTSSVFGFDVRAGVGGETSFGLSYGIHLGYQRWSMLFTGMSAVADNAGVEGADASFLAHATLGFVVPE
jgi:hypothetical protein